MEENRQQNIGILIGSLNGNVMSQHINPTTQNENEEAETAASPIHLSKNVGVKLDFIRVMYAWYECGKITDANGGKLSKKDYFEALGKAFNIDLSNYNNLLSTSMGKSSNYGKQTEIFDMMKKKIEDIYNSK